MKPGTAVLVSRMTTKQKEQFEERAGIFEYDGGLDRDKAEYYAALDVLNIKLPTKEIQWDTEAP